MRKLSLNNFNLSADDLLQPKQLKTILGGYSGGGWCSQTGCEGKSSGSECVINQQAGRCRYGYCDSERMLLCYTS